ncbi:MAG: TolC family outer membrane protein [Gammaproteobacteria bacterium]|nr:TolC family outer membrane protein [Gammaproteobacteria bacterium]
MRLRHWKVVGAGLLLSISAQTYAVTLSEVSRQTLATNPEVRASLANRTARAYEVNQAVGQYLPQFSARAAGGRERAVNPTVRALKNSKGHLTLDRSEFSLTASQLIVDGWGVGSSIHERVFDSRSAKFDLRNTCNNVMLQMAEAYLNVKRQREILVIAQKNVNSHKETLRKVRLRFKGGAGTRVDVELADARLARSEAQFRESKRLLEEAETRYCTVANQAPAVDLAMPIQPVRFLPRNLFNAVTIAMENNPAILASINTSQAAKAHIGVIRSRFYPRVDAELTARADNNLSGVEGSDGSVMGMAVLSYNFVAGGSDVAAYNTAAFDRVQAQQKSLDIARKVRERVRDAWSNFTSSRDSISIFKGSVNANTQVVRDYIKQFELGQRELFNVLDAQDDLYAAQNALVSANYDNAIAYYRVLEAIGTISLQSLI